MPDIPFIARKFAGGGSNPSAPGWLASYGTYVAAAASLVCQPLTNGHFSWTTSGGATGSGLALSPSGVGAISDFTKYRQVSITPPGTDDIAAFARYYDTTTTYTHIAERLSGPTGTVGYENLDVSVTQPIDGSSEVTLEAKYFNYDEYINGDLFYRTFDRIELMAGGVVYSKLFADMTHTTGTTTPVGNLTNVDTSTLDAISYKQYESEAIFTFPLIAEDISIRLGTPYGTWRPWIALKWKPAGSFTLAIEDDTATLDATQIYVVGGHIATGNGLSYTFDDAGISQPLVTDETVTTHGIDGHSMNDGDILTATLLATSDEGCTNTFTASDAIEESNTISGISDSDGVGYETVKSGADLVTYQYTSDYANRVLKSTLPNHDNPTLYQIEGSSRFFLAARNKETDSYTLYHSDNNCASWTVLS